MNRLNEPGRSRRAGRSRPALVLLVALALSGCAREGAQPPAGEVARFSLDMALKTWREGGKPGRLPGTSPPVEVHDTPWTQGAKLGSYEILREEAGTAQRSFDVRLSLAKPEGVKEVKYYVLGQDPVMVFRDEDYARNINMENGPGTPRVGKQRSSRRN